MAPEHQEQLFDSRDPVAETELYDDNVKRVMVDLETMGEDPGSAIVSIGAVGFTNGALGDEFYQKVDITSCEKKGLGVEAGTALWWLDQSDEAKEALSGDESIYTALSNFSSWYKKHDFDEIWANSPSFDCAFLIHAYRAIGRDGRHPWKYYEQRDARTVTDLPCAVSVEFDGAKHNALNDARNQAREVSQTLQLLYEYE